MSNALALAIDQVEADLAKIHRPRETLLALQWNRLDWVMRKATEGDRPDMRCVLRAITLQCDIMGLYAKDEASEAMNLAESIIDAVVRVVEHDVQDTRTRDAILSKLKDLMGQRRPETITAAVTIVQKNGNGKNGTGA